MPSEESLKNKLLTSKQMISLIGKKALNDREVSGPYKTNAAEFIKGYYGGEEQLRKELAAAKNYGKGEMRSRPYKNYNAAERREDFLNKKNIEERMFQDVPVYVNPNYGASYNIKDETVNVGGPRAVKIGLHNADLALDQTTKEGINQIEADRLQDRYIDNLIFNEFTNFGGFVGLEDKDLQIDRDDDSAMEKRAGEIKDDVTRTSLEHELGHKVYRAEKFAPKADSFNKRYRDAINADSPSRKPTVYPPRSGDIKKSYFDDRAELFQALGKFQREHFKETGKRLTKPDQLYKLIKSDENFDYLSKEGSRLINYLRKQSKGNNSEQRLKFFSELAPMFVEKEDSFQEAINKRMS